MDKSIAGKLLFAKLFRARGGIGDYRPDFDSINFHPVIQHGESDVLSYFGGFFTDMQSLQMLTFGISFSDTSCGPRSGIYKFAASGITRHDNLEFGFLSVIDYLVQVGMLRPDSVEDHIQRITKGGALKKRMANCMTYGNFCKSVCDSLPYDLSLDVARELEYATLEQAA